MLETDLDRRLATRASTDCTCDRFESLDDVFDLLHSGAAGTGWSVGRHRPWVHATQTAALARQAGACDDLITAALLHDIGQLVSGNSAGYGGFGIGMSDSFFRKDEVSAKWGQLHSRSRLRVLSVARRAPSV